MDALGWLLSISIRRYPSGNGRDEDKNLKGPAASGEASPLPEFFETLKHREQDPERVFS
jgi:hypothetical protein